MSIEKIDDLRRYAFDLAGLPPDYDGDVLTPQQLSKHPIPNEIERRFYEKVGMAAIFFMNRRKTK